MTKRRLQWSKIAYIALSLAVGFLLGCGDEDKGPNLPPQDPRGPGFANAQQTQEVPTLTDDGMVAVPSEKWDRIKMFFEAYAGATTTNRRDPYRNNLAGFAQKPDLPKLNEEEPEEETVEQVVESLSPLEKFPVEDFTLVMVMSGTSRPKAVVMDPVGIPWVVRPDTPLGNEGGLVQAITQYSIVVAEPGSDTPSEITIRPMILDAAAELADKEKVNFSSKPLTTAPIR